MMLNLVPQPEPQAAPQLAPEPVTRLASLHHALRLVDDFGGGPASDFDIDEIAGDWAEASDAEQRCFERRSAALLAAASAGLDVVTRHAPTAATSARRPCSCWPTRSAPALRTSSG